MTVRPLATPFWILKTYADDTKAVTTATIKRVEPGVARTMGLMAPYTYAIPIFLDDKATAGIAKSQYFELNIGYDSPQTHVWCSGYIQNLAKDDTRTSNYTLQAASASIYLSHSTVGSPMFTKPSIHANLIDFLNGVQHPPASGLYPPPYRGVLSETGFTAEWLDPNGSSPPGVGDVWRYDWATPLDLLNWFCQHYNCYWREKPGRVNKKGDCIIQIGPLNDDSGLFIWGADELKAKLNTDLGAAYSGAGFTMPNAQLAQADGLAQIIAASYTDDLTRSVSIVWPHGSGTTADTGRNISTLVGGEPLDSGGSIINGWASWKPFSFGKQFYVKTASRTTYLGNTFEFIAHETQKSSAAQRYFNYGVVNRGPSPGAGPDPFGAKELFLPETAIHDPSALLSAALGRLEYSSLPVKGYTFSVAHPLTSASGVPDYPLPGQRVTIMYNGTVHDALDWDTDTTSHTYGQMVGVGAYTYLKFPKTGSATDEDGTTYTADQIQKMSRIISLDDTWTGGQYVQNLTVGRKKDFIKAWRDDFARRMERNTKKKPQHLKHTFKWKPFEGVGFAFWGGAEEDEAGNSVSFPPASGIISDVSDSNFFNDNRAVSFTFAFGDPTAVLWFIFDKKVDSLITSLNSSQSYRVVRLARSGSAVASGLYSASTSGVLTAVGKVHRASLLNTDKRLGSNAYRATIRERGGRIEVTLAGQDATLPSGITTEEVIATWLDTNASNWGAIGFWYDGASNGTLTQLHAHAHHHQQPAKGTIFPSHMGPTNQVGHRRQPTGSGGAGFSISHEQPT